MWSCSLDVYRYGQAVAVCNRHDFRAFAALCLSNLGAPFLAGASIDKSFQEIDANLGLSYYEQVRGLEFWDHVQQQGLQRVLRRLLRTGGVQFSDFGVFEPLGSGNS